MTKVKKTNFNTNGSDFISSVGYFDYNTLITKNGQLIQVISISDTHKLGNQITLFHSIRTQLRKSIAANAGSDKFAFCLSVVRTKANLRNSFNCQIPLCKDLDEAWNQQNSWDSRYSNTLYISIIYHNATLEVNNFASFVNSFDKKIIFNFHNNYLQSIIGELSQLTQKIYKDLEIFNAMQLKIIAKDDGHFSQLQSFLEQILYIHQEECPLQDADLSVLIEPDSYCVGDDYINFNYKGESKFSSIIGIKEYQEMPSDVLDSVLQAPCQMVITESFTFIDKKSATEDFKDTHYMLSLGKDAEMQKAVRIDEMLNEGREKQGFCSQQINISAIENSIQDLQASVSTISKLMSEIGIVNVLEDIDVEYAFWSKIPGNFAFIKRASPILSKYVGGFSSLFSFPSGDMKNVWGDLLVILKTLHNTPYYFNFHDKEKGHTVILSGKRQGKTVMLNFLLAMAMQYGPQVLYLADSEKSNAFLELIGGKVLDHLSLPNPLLYMDEGQVFQWLSILCGHKTSILQEAEIEAVKGVAQYLMSLPRQERLFSKIAQFDFAKFQGADIIKTRLELFISDEKYNKILFNNADDLSKVCGINLSFFTNKNFKEAYYPKHESLIPKYRQDLMVHVDLRSAVMFAMMHIFAGSNSPDPKILVLSNLDTLISVTHFNSEISKLLDQITQNNGIILSALDLSNYKDFENSQFWSVFLEKQAALIALAGEGIKKSLRGFLNFSEEEMQIMLKMPPKSRYFLVKQYGFILTAEMDLSTMPKFTKILSQLPQDMQFYEQTKAVQQNNESVLNILYKKFQD